MRESESPVPSQTGQREVPDPSGLAQFGLPTRLLLGWLWRYPYQRALDLAVALPASSPRLDDSLVLRNLARLRAAGLIEAVRLACVDAALYRLTTRGALLVEGERRGGQPFPDPLAVPRLVHLQRVVLGLAAYAPQHLAAHFRGHAPSLAWHLVRDALLPTPAAAGNALLWLACPVEQGDGSGISGSPSADGGLLPLAAGAAAMTAGVSPRALARGYGAYVFYSPASDPRSRARLLLAAVARERARVSCPFPVLILLQDGAHTRIWHQAARDLPRSTDVKPEDLTGATAVLPDEDTGLCDPWRLRWQRLPDGAPVRLPALLDPVPVTRWPDGLLADLSETTARLRPLRAGRSRHAASTRGTHPVKAGGKDRESAACCAPLLSVPPGSSGTAPAGWSRPAAAEPEDPDRCADRTRQETGAARLLPDLGVRHLSLLRLLARHPLARLEELAVFAALSPASVARYLSACRPLAEQVVWEGQQRVQLSQAGQRFVAGLDGVSPLTIARLQATVRVRGPAGSREGSEPAIRRERLSVYEALAVFARHAEGIGQGSRGRVDGQGVILHGWEMPPVCCRQFLWHGAWQRFCPDAEIVVSSDGRRAVLWLLDQRIGFRERAVTQTLDALLTFVRAREDRVEGLPLPARLLVLVHSRAQEHQVAEVTGTTLPAGLLVRVFTGLHETFVVRGPFAAIWRQVYPAQGAQGRQALFSLP